MSRIYRDSITQSSFTALNILCALSIYPSLGPPEPLATADLSTVSTVFCFPERHILGLIRYVAFSDWFLSLSYMHLSFLHIFSWLDSSFVFSMEWYFVVWMCLPLTIH